MLATLLLSIGTPMIVGGDERWRTQGGNNNAYCRDDETSWVDWTDTSEAALMEAFTARVAKIRRESPVLHRDQFYVDGEVLWWHPSGRPMEDGDWHDGGARTLAVVLADYYLLLMHAGDGAAACTLPKDHDYEPVLDSTVADGTPASTRPLRRGATITLPPRSVLLLRSL
jgi:glycogen operon protein